MNYKPILLILLFISFIIITSFAIIEASFGELLVFIILLVILNLVVLKEEWRAQFFFIKVATVITATMIIIFSVVFKIFNIEIFLYFSKLLTVGLVSIIFFIPSVFDQFLRIVSFNDKISYFSEALVLYRNILNGTANEFAFGLQSSRTIKTRSIRDRIQYLGLISITLVGRIIFINDDLLISTRIRQFSIQNVKFLFNIKFINVIIIIIVMILSLTFIIL